MNKYHRRQRLQRFLSARERKRFVCGTKRIFASREDALACQPSQAAYRCKVCCQWHLTAKKERSFMKVAVVMVIAVLMVVTQIAELEFR